MSSSKSYVEQLKAGKPKCYAKMNEMKALPEKCKICIYKLDCLISTAKKLGWLK